MEAKLAIIIPAYKSLFLKETLNSFTKQTNKDFIIYIGDDESPHNIKEIVDCFTDKLNIIYHRFEGNLGSKSLSKQWQRCVELSTEQWIWLFSDDDIVTPTCVESFFSAVKLNKKSKLFKFYTEIIDKNSNIKKLYFDITNSYKESITAEEFIKNRLKNRCFRSYMVEYIFERSLFNKLKFVDFPLSWIADDATWYLYAKENCGITVVKDFVYWRFSGSNLSSDRDSENIIKLKLEANRKFLEWTISVNIFKDNKNDILNYLFKQHFALLKSLDYTQKVMYNNYHDTFTSSQIRNIKYRHQLEIIKEKLKSRIKFIFKL